MKFARIVELTDLMRALHAEVAQGYVDRGCESMYLSEQWHAVMRGLIEAERNLIDIRMYANQID